METNEKFVRFDEYCKKCTYAKVPEVEEPCNSCLTQPVNENSHKPVNYIEKEKK